MKNVVIGIVVLLVLGVAYVMLQRGGDEAAQQEQAAPAAAAPGVDAQNKIVRIGALNDESGPAAAIGKPYALGKRLLAMNVNGGNSGLLPDGWKIELVEKDHGYNPQHAVQAYNEIKDQVLFIGTSFGTPNTLPLRSMLEADNLVAFPASLSSKMAEHKYTPPLGTPYSAEAMRAMDWVVEKAGGADKVQAGIVYQQDDYGLDGLEGWKKAAEFHGVKVVSEQTVAPGQTDYTAVVTALKQAGANYILLTTLPSATGPILGTAAQLQFMPVWVGNTPAWIDGFFNPKVIPAAVFTNYYWATGLPTWGEVGVEGMAAFLKVYETHGSHINAPQDFYVLASYAQGVLQLEALKKAIEAGDVTRASYLKQLQSLKGATAGGLVQPVDLTKFPYETSITARILKPDMAAKKWTVEAGFAAPKASAAGAGAAAGATAPADGQ